MFVFVRYNYNAVLCSQVNVYRDFMLYAKQSLPFGSSNSLEQIIFWCFKYFWIFVHELKSNICETSWGDFSELLKMIRK